MIKFSQYECGSRLGSILNKIDWEELILSCKEEASASWNKLSWEPVTYTDYAVNLAASVQGTTSTSYYIPWP